ncbi:unnamed protein product [Dibothriocephalus latus]|uniref:Uncharacterized protein n=1 Tax=Dibothriocephalus latus TaxID=60516 RepID=A0A3P7M8Q6_DIBLA|nr:unnamed protein product [Dibothriocephalus latus]
MGPEESSALGSAPSQSTSEAKSALAFPVGDPFDFGAFLPALPLLFDILFATLRLRFLTFLFPGLHWDHPPSRFVPMALDFPLPLPLLSSPLSQ